MEARQEEAQTKKKRGNAAKFAGGFLAACIAAAAFFFLGARLAYSMRLSLELIHAGIIVWYILPCMIGGRVLKASGCSPAPLAAIVLGSSFFAVLYGCSCICCKRVLSFSGNVLTVFFLCVAAALLGITGRKKQ